MFPEAFFLYDLNRRGIVLSCDGTHIIAQPKSAITPEIREFIKTHKRDLMQVIMEAEVHKPSLSKPDPVIRRHLMRIMTDWNERAAIMAYDGNASVEQAELAAWHDLNLDEIFFGVRKIH